MLNDMDRYVELMCDVCDMCDMCVRAGGARDCDASLRLLERHG